MSLASAVVEPYGVLWSPTGRKADLRKLSEEVEEYFNLGLSLREGDVVIDVGANVGLFALAAARRVDHLRYVGFEPVPELFAALERNLGTLSPDRPKPSLFQLALGATANERDVEFFYFRNFPSDSTRYIDEKRKEHERFWTWALGRGPTGFVMKRVVRRTMRSRFGVWLADTVTGMTRVSAGATTLSEMIDRENLGAIGALKVDVEGAELDVLAGISDVHLARVRQVALEGHDEDGQLGRIKARLAAAGLDRIDVTWSAAHKERGQNNFLLLARRGAAEDTTNGATT